MPITTQPVKGMYLLEEGRVFIVQERQLKTQGRQGGLIILKMKALDNGQIVNKQLKLELRLSMLSQKQRKYSFSTLIMKVLTYGI